MEQYCFQGELFSCALVCFFYIIGGGWRFVRQHICKCNIQWAYRKRFLLSYPTIDYVWRHIFFCTQMMSTKSNEITCITTTKSTFQILLQGNGSGSHKGFLILALNFTMMKMNTTTIFLIDLTSTIGSTIPTIDTQISTQNTNIIGLLPITNLE